MVGSKADPAILKGKEALVVAVFLATGQHHFAHLPRLGGPQNLALNFSGQLLQSNLAVSSGTGETAQTTVTDQPPEKMSLPIGKRKVCLPPGENYSNLPDDWTINPNDYLYQTKRKKKTFLLAVSGTDKTTNSVPPFQSEETPLVSLITASGRKDEANKNHLNGEIPTQNSITRLDSKATPQQRSLKMCQP
jgi:hypothetical protein